MIRNLIALLLLTSQAFAGLPPTTLKGQGGSKVTTFNFQVPQNQATQVSGVDSLIETGNRNILPNPGFEGTTGWTASGGATTAINTTAVGTGVNGYDWDSNSAAQTLTGTAVTIPNGLKGKNGVVSCNIYTVSGSATHLLKAYDGTNDVVSGSIQSVSGSYIRTSLNFVFPSSGTITVRLTSVASNEPEIYIDDCYLGPADGLNIGTVAQFGTWTAYGSASSWTALGSPTSNYLEYRTAPQGIEVRFKVTSGVSTGSPLALALPSICTTASNYNSNELAGPASITTTTGRSWSVLVGASATSVNFGDIGTSNAFTARNGSALISTGEIAAGEFYVRCQGFGSNQIYSPEQQNSWGSTYWPDGTSSFTTTSASFTAVTAASMLGTAVRTGQAQACSDTNAICLKVPTLQAGSYKIDYAGGAAGDGSAGCVLSVYDGSTDYEIAPGAGAFSSAGHTVITYSAVQSNKEFTIRIKRVVGAGNCTVSTSYNEGHNLTITPLDQKMPAPVLVGSVTNGSTGAMRVEAAKIAAPSGGSCTVTESGGSDWINGNGTSGSTGNCSMTFNTGIWSAAPVCTCSQSGSNSKICSINTAETTTTVVTQTVTDGGAASDSIVNLHCIGPR